MKAPSRRTDTTAPGSSTRSSTAAITASRPTSRSRTVRGESSVDTTTKGVRVSSGMISATPCQSTRHGSPSTTTQLAVEPVDRAEPVIATGERLAEGGHAVEAAVEQDMRQLQLVGDVGGGALAGVDPAGAPQGRCGDKGGIEGHGRILARRPADPLPLGADAPYSWPMGGEGSPDRRRDGRTRVRAWRIRLSTLLSRQGVRSALRLGLIAAYSVVFMWGGFFDWAGWAETILWSLGAVLWLVVAAMLVRELVTSDHRLRHWREPFAGAAARRAGLPVADLDAARRLHARRRRVRARPPQPLGGRRIPVLVRPGALRRCLRRPEHGRGGVREPGVDLDTPADAIFWAFASLLRINYGKAFSPVTEEGRILATVVGICAGALRQPVHGPGGEVAGRHQG